MQRYQVCTVFITILFSVHLNEAEWLKRYEENYHRPTYYNKAHKSMMHVDYSRDLMDHRDDKVKEHHQTEPPFDPKIKKSYYVNVLYSGSVICAGALISQRMVVTSSRCFLADERDPTKEFKAEHMSVINGDDFNSADKKVSDVIGFFMPPARNVDEGVHDIALLTLKEKLPHDEYRHIYLYSRMPKPGDPVTMSFVDIQSHDIVLYNTTVFDTERCKQSYEKVAGVHVPFDKEFFCVTNRQNHGCSTRRGDPLIIEEHLAGINVYGEHCDKLEGTRKSDIYVSMRHTDKFIQRATDLIRAFTDTGPFNDSMTTQRTELFQEETTLAPYL